MRNPEDLLLSLRQRGVRIWAENGRIQFKAPKGAVLPEDLSSLQDCKAEFLALLGQSRTLTEIPLLPRPPGCVAPLSAMQRRTWQYTQDRQGGLSKRATTDMMRVEGPLSADLLQSCVEAVAMRHESLRTTFAAADGVPFQRVAAEYGHGMEIIDLTSASPVDVKSEIHSACEAFTWRATDLAVGPLFRALLLKVSRHEHVLVLAIDHTITDAISNSIIRNEIWTLYGQATAGASMSLPALPIQFADYALWQERTRASWLERHYPYWVERLKGLRPTELPTDSWLPKLEGPPSAIFHAALGEQLSRELAKLAKREGVPLALAVLTVHVAVMSRWANQRNVVVTTTWNARYRPELEGLVGWVANNLHLRVEICPGDRLLDLLRRVVREFHCAIEHKDFDWVPDLMPEWWVDPMASFNWLTDSSDGQRTQSALPVKIHGFGINGEPPPWKFRPFFGDTPSGVQISVQYRRDLFSPDTLQRFANHLCAFAHTFTRNPHARVGSLEFLR